MLKRICIISPAVYPLLCGDKSIKSAGGAEAQLKEIGEALAEKGYEVHYIVDDFGQEQCKKINNVWAHKAALRYMGGSNLFLIPDWIKLLIVLWRINADYHVIKLPRNLMVPLGLYCKLRRRSLIFIGQIDNDVDLEFIKNQDGYITFYLYKIGLKFVNAIVSQNEIQREGFSKLTGKRVQTIKSMVTLPDAENINKDDYILWVGSSLAKKQPEMFIQLARKLPDIRFVMILAPANLELFEQVKSQAATVPNLEFKGFVPLSDIWVYFSKARLFVSTSLREGFPNTFLQSWQYGTPVVSLGVDPDSVISRCSLGRVSGTFEMLCVDVNELFEDSAMLSKCAENSLEYISTNHSKNVIIEQYISLLKAL